MPTVVNPNALVQRFQRSRWSNTRTVIDSLVEGQCASLPLSEYDNADTSMRRLAYAYDDGRHFSLRRLGNRIIVRRLPPDAPPSSQ